MTGIYEHSIDAKGRLFIPAKLRQDLGETFYITISSEPCLSAYSSEVWEKMKERVSAMSRLEQKKARPIFAHAARCELDAQGRILLPQRLRDFAKLTKDVSIVGIGTSVEIWDKAAWDEIDAMETTPENIEKVFMELDF
ncbi:MAG TPA: division/cell wall cluster transcriptional repressor MraZ [Papillibacter sp.]|jgi:MraZ protein|nr:division/cell wall cluster transcriptional repressor MraZ [Papillibacter sp.]